MYNTQYEIAQWMGGGINLSSRAIKVWAGHDVVICISDSEAWDYMPLLSSVIPANLGFSFTLLCGHYIPQSTGDWEYGGTKGSSEYRVFLMKDVSAAPGSNLAVHSVGGTLLSSFMCLHIWEQWNSRAQVE